MVHMVIPILGRQRQMDRKFKASLGFTVSSRPDGAT
jgi:hypothetical protein